MARSAVLEAPTGEDHDDVIDWYRRKLIDEPAELPWAGSDWAPVTVGPVWQVDKRGHWVLPEATLGWDALGWCGTELQHGYQTPWRFTLEQARFLLWWYAVDEHGRWLADDFVLQRLKGWGKDPLGGCLIYLELLGPCRFAGWDGSRPVAADNPNAWVQTAATSLDQTKNTMRLMPGLITPEAKGHYRVQVGKEMIHALDGERMAQAVTSSPTTLEGARASFVLKNETHHWDSSNGGHDMADVIERNSAKSADAAARTGAITNAYEPGMDSVAERDRDAYTTNLAAGVKSSILYDSLEASPEAPIAIPRLDDESPAEYEERVAETVAGVVKPIRGDSTWLDPDRIVRSILDPRNPPSRSRRFWYNQIVAAEDAWLDPAKVDLAGRDDKDFTGEIVMFFDGSKSDDATGLVGCRVDDGHLLTLGVWQRPAGASGVGWVVPRHEVDQKVRSLLDSGQVIGFYADPSHAKDDDVTGFWDSIIDGWHRDYHDKLRHWSLRSGDRTHSIMWDMASPARAKEHTLAAMQFVDDMESTPPKVTHDNHPALVQHLKQARRRPSKYGIGLGKEHRESSKKIDLAVCAVGARMLRRAVLNKPEKNRSGTVWGAW